MNIPNKLTILRVLLIPVMVVVFYLDPDPNGLNLFTMIIVGIFILASFTDFLDGYLARKNNMVTTFGKFLDPLADKLLVTFGLLMLLAIGTIDMWIVLVILGREFIVTGIRLVAMQEGNVIAASTLGKYKTVFTIVAIVGLMLHVYLIGTIILYVAVLLTVLSGIEYFVLNKKNILKSK